MGCLPDLRSRQAALIESRDAVSTIHGRYLSLLLSRNLIPKMLKCLRNTKCYLTRLESFRKLAPLFELHGPSGLC